MTTLTVDEIVTRYQQAMDTLQDENASLLLENNALKATNACYLNTLHAIQRDLGYPARAKVDRLIGKCEL